MNAPKNDILESLQKTQHQVTELAAEMKYFRREFQDLKSEIHNKSLCDPAVIDLVKQLNYSVYGINGNGLKNSVAANQKEILTLRSKTQQQILENRREIDKYKNQGLGMWRLLAIASIILSLITSAAAMGILPKR